MAIRRTRTSVQVATGLSAIGAVTAAGLVGVVPPAAADTPTEPAQRPGAHTRPVPMLPSSAERTHTVRLGETVSALAARYSTTIAAIVQANDLNARAMIYVGQVLTIPTAAVASSATSSGSATPATTSTASGTSTYTVASGDTLSGIAAAHDTTVTQLMSLNSLSSSVIHPGQKLTVAGTSAGTAPSPSAPSAAAPTTGSTYTVRSADTVSAIAARFGTTVSAIVAANDLNSRALIRIGQVLTIPGAAAPSTSSSPAAPTSTTSVSAGAETSYTVVPGDTLSGIAAKHDTSIGAITTLNELGSSTIYPGQVLKVQGQLVPSTFLHYTYPEETVAAANQNKQELLDAGVPSRQEMRDIIRTTAQQMGVDPALALAVAQQESGFDQAAVSPANAIGAMQVIPTSGEWASDLVGRDLDLLDPHDNAVAGVAILRWLVGNAPDLPSAIAGYYQGMGSVNRNGMYADTRRYVANVQTLMTRYA